MPVQWIGPMPYDAFLADFMPASPSFRPPKFSKDHFSGMRLSKKKDMYPQIIERINEIKGLLAKGTQLVDSSDRPDKNSTHGCKIKIDLLQYFSEVAVKDSRAQFQAALLAYELNKDEVFDILDDELGDPKSKPSQDSSQDCIETRGQLATYTTEIFARQHRTHCFMVFICHPYVRFIRWDRSAAVVTRRYDYTADCTPLIEFLCRFEHLSKAEQGLDPTVEIVKGTVADRVKVLLKPWASGNVSRDVLKMEVPNGDAEMLSFYVWHALAELHSPTGRGTRGYPAVECDPEGELGAVMFLKDQWRSVALEPEVETLRELNAKQVRNVPTLHCGGDIGLTLERMGRSSAYQTTVSHAYSDASWRIRDSSSHPEERIHLRFVVVEVGQPLHRFPSTKTFLTAIYDAFIGHQDAYDKCDKLLHRDISGGNILIVDGKRGLLIDWDLARKESNVDGDPRDNVRTGTWPFMSTRLLRQPDVRHMVSDDIESFFWVVLYHGLLYAPHNHAKGVTSLIQAIFFSAELLDFGYHGGSSKFSLILMGDYFGVDNERELKFDHCEPLTWFVLEYLKLLRELLLSEADVSDHLRASVAQLFRKAIEDRPWPLNDEAVDQSKLFKKAR